MKKAPVALAALFMLWGMPAHAMFPLVENDYLKSEEEHFTAADINKNGVIDREEARSAYTNMELLPNEAARAACSKVGKDLSVQYNPSADDRDFHALTKAQYMDSRKSMFDHIDANHDHVIMQSEMDAFSAQMVKVCKEAPAVIQQMKELEGSDTFKNLPPAERVKMLQRLRIMQGKE